MRYYRMILDFTNVKLLLDYIPVHILKKTKRMSVQEVLLFVYSKAVNLKYDFLQVTKTPVDQQTNPMPMTFFKSHARIPRGSQVFPFTGRGRHLHNQGGRGGGGDQSRAGN